MLQTLKKQSKSKILLKVKVKNFLTKQLWQHLIVVAFVAFTAWIFCKPWEAIMFCVSHLVIRRLFDKQYHCGTIALCLFTTLTIAFLGIATCMPVTLSLLSSIPVCCFVAWVGYIAQDRIDLIAFRRKKEEFNLDTCTREQIVEVCKLLHYRADKIDLAVMFFADKMTVGDVWDWLADHSYYIEYDTVKQYKYRIKKDLEKFIAK